MSTQPNPVFGRDWQVYVRFAACVLLNFWDAAGQVLQSASSSI